MSCVLMPTCRCEIPNNDIARPVPALPPTSDLRNASSTAAALRTRRCRLARFRKILMVCFFCATLESRFSGPPRTLNLSSNLSGPHKNVQDHPKTGYFAARTLAPRSKTAIFSIS